jgi:hypothetical protein
MAVLLALASSLLQLAPQQLAQQPEQSLALG